jgi:DNA-binding MarR family transcriptional regulator
MTSDPELKLQECNCLALRHAARYVTQFYDRHLAVTQLRTTQFSVLAKLERLGAMSINALAAEMVMDRTTLGRNILPLERDGLIAIKQEESDRRSKKLYLTKAGAERLRRARTLWVEAQNEFETAVGEKHAADLRALLGAVVSSALGAPDQLRTIESE